jgi:hypothetical protein
MIDPTEDEISFLRKLELSFRDGVSMTTLGHKRTSLPRFRMSALAVTEKLACIIAWAFVWWGGGCPGKEGPTA